MKIYFTLNNVIANSYDMGKLHANNVPVFTIEKFKLEIEILLIFH